MQTKRIGIFTGLAWEKWDLNTYKDRGIGGSETCAGRLAETAAEQGHAVVLYGDFDQKIQHGVQLVPWQKFNPEKEFFDLFIISRDLGCLNEKLKASKIVVWIHDVCLTTGKPLTDFQRRMIDKFIVLSPWHHDFVKRYYGLQQDKLEIIPHGVNIELFDPYSADQKEFGKFLWTSSADRGLENLLDLFPRIKEKVPEAHLEVTYGFHNWLSFVVKNRDINTLKRIDKLKNHMDTCGYVNYRGRINQKELAKSWGSSYLWLYPTAFHETYCLSAMEAQASGTPIISSNVAALQTTVGAYGQLIESDPYSKIGQKEFINAAVEKLKNKHLWQEMSAKSLSGAIRVSWTDRWNQYWSRLLIFNVFLIAFYYQNDIIILKCI